MQREGYHQPQRIPFLDERPGNASFERLARTKRTGHIQSVEGMLARKIAPVILQALGRNTGTNSPAEGQALGESGVVPVEQRGGIRRQRVDLNECRCHGTYGFG